MVKKAVIVLAEGFEEIEAVTPIDVLRRAEIEVVVAGLSGKIIKSARYVSISADVLLGELKELPDALILPGGLPGSHNLANSKELADLLEKMNATGKFIAAICAAPALVLAPLGILDGKKATCYPGCEKGFSENVRYAKERVKTDDHIITSQGPGTALEFSLEIARRLAGDEKANQLKEAMLLAD